MADETKARVDENIRDLRETLQPESIIADAPAQNQTQIDRFLTESSHQIYITDRVAPWWSRWRDRYLWETLIRSDVLSSAIYVTSARLFSVPLNIAPKDKSNRRIRDIASWSDALLKYSWSTEIMRFIIDWQTQDNGAFLEILGGGDPSGPIEPTIVPGTATYLYGLGLRHLDSQCSWRTGDYTYPVIYESRDSRGRLKRYKMHRSRVLFTAQMESPRANMLKVGFSGVSRIIHHTLHLDDIDILKEEWLGSRPVSEIIFGTGMTSKEIERAFLSADEKAASDGQRRYAKVVFLGLDGNPDMLRASRLERIQLKRLPEGYDEEKSLTVAINVMAMGLGFDARTLWPATVRGATRADAEVQHLKTMKMTPGLWVETVKSCLQEKFCPASCEVTADQQDDEQDSLVASNRQSRVTTRQLAITSGQIDHRVAYQQALEDGDITEDQYNYLVKRLDKLEAEGVPLPGMPTVAKPGEEETQGGSEKPKPAKPTSDATGKMAHDLLKELVGTGELVSVTGPVEFNGNGYHAR